MRCAHILSQIINYDIISIYETEGDLDAKETVSMHERSGTV